MAVAGNTAPIITGFKLTVRNTRGAGTSEFSFNTGILTAGRDESCDIVLDSERVSRTHAAFSVRDGQLWVEDLGSANGTRVNEKKITSGRELRDDDVVRIGDFVITISGAAPRPVLYLRLQGVSRDVRGSSYEFVKSPSMVGRGADADVVIVHPAVSRRHCRVERRSDGSVLVSDLDSANGLRVNGAAVKVSQVIQGDTISLGDVEFMVEMPGRPTIPAIMMPRGRLAAVRDFLHGRTFVWIVVALLSAVAVVIAGWTLGGMGRAARTGSDAFQVDKVAE